MHGLLFCRISSSCITSCKDLLIMSTTWVDALSVQEDFWPNLLPSPYLCNFLFRFGSHGFSLFRDPSQVTIMSHMFNFMAIEAFHLIQEWGSMCSCKVASRRHTRTIIFFLVVFPTILFHMPKICTRIEITKKYTLVPRRWRFHLCTSEFILSWDSLIKLISSYILDTICKSPWSIISSVVVLILLLAFARTRSINISF